MGQFLMLSLITIFSAAMTALTSWIKSSASCRAMNKGLYIAAASDNVEELEQLRRQGVVIFNEVTPKHNTVLHIAASYGSKRFVERLLIIRAAYGQGGSSVSGSHGLLAKQNSQGNTALHEAASGGHGEIVENLLKEERALASVTNNAGETPVFNAALAGHTHIIEKIEEVVGVTPVEMHTRESDGQTSLHFAVFNRRIGVIEKLIHMKPELVQKADNMGRTPLHVAALIPPIKELITEPLLPWLYDKHATQNLYIANMLLKIDGDLCDKLDDKGQTPLHIAVKEGNAIIVKLMLEKGGDCIERVDEQGRNALHLAVINAELIFERNSGAMSPMLHSLVTSTKRLINDCDIHGKTALDIAIDNIDKDESLFSTIIKVLQRNGAIRNVNLAAEAESKRIETSKSRWNIEIIAWNAVLIGTVAFAAPFALFGANPLDEKHFQFNTKHERVFYGTLLYVFIIFDTLALGTSVATTILMLKAVFGKKEDTAMVQTTFWTVQAALLSILTAFGSAIALALGPKYLWLILFVWFLLCVSPIAVRKRTFRSKYLMSREAKSVMKFIIQDSIGLVIILFYDYFISRV